MKIPKAPAILSSVTNRIASGSLFHFEILKKTLARTKDILGKLNPK